MGSLKCEKILAKAFCKENERKFKLGAFSSDRQCACVSDGSSVRFFLKSLVGACETKIQNIVN